MFGAVSPKDVIENYLLAALPAEEFIRIVPKLEPVFFKIGDVIFEANEKIDYIYFPTSAVISSLYTLETGATAGVCMIGREGAVGIAVFLGGETSPSQAIVHSAGKVFRMKATDLQKEFIRNETLHVLLLRFTMALIAQISQSAVCYRLHTIEQQLCRLMLLTHDRLNCNKLEMTHDFIAIMLGVRRESVSLAAHKLAQRNWIENLRGTIRIIKREGLEECVCECYKTVNNQYHHLLGRDIVRVF